jgi:hypothetical protein
MAPALAADLLVVVHAAFVAFVICGGLLVLRWPRAAWLHVPAATWGALVELTGWICPLTPLENALRERAGLDVYAGDFVGRYLLPVLYPEGLTRATQLVLGLTVIVINVAVYALAFHRARRGCPPFQ